MVRKVALVLCIAAQSALAETRRLILTAAGHRVVSAMSIPEVEQAGANNDFDVAVIGQGIPAKEKLRIIELVRRACPTSKILELHTTPSGRTLPDADDWLPVPAEVPSDLAERVTALAKRKTSPRKKSKAKSAER
jgi:DNA-binding response OmpR family regulator